jgi:hypothetical protein
MRRMVFLLVVVIAAVFAANAGATTTTFDANGTVLLNGAKVFPLVLAKGPPRTGTTPTGANALSEVVGAGVTFFKVGPGTTTWTSADITDVNEWDRAVAARGAYTWINLNTLSQATPGSTTDSLLRQVVTTLLADPGSAGIGMWKGAEEPWWGKIVPSALQFSYCRVTSRGSPGWCGGEPWLDQNHLSVAIEAPRGTVSDLSPYSSVTDVHGVDDYPVTLAAGTNPNLHQVGLWTSTISAATPSHSIWTTLQVCASGSYDANGNYVLPSVLQERYMIYDAILNGARSLAFFGGTTVECMNATDKSYGWNWTFWNTVLKGLVQEINAGSPLAPALVSPASTQTLTSNDSTTQVISRQGSTASDLWVIAARSGSGSQNVTISGLPAAVTSGSVYTENRSVPVSNGTLTDTFGQWGVHVYHLSTTTTTAAPTISSFTPASGPPGTLVTVSGTNLTGATSVTFNGAAASYTVDPTGNQITATVPNGAASGPIRVTSGGGTAVSASGFTVTTPDFKLTPLPVSRTVVRGRNTSYTITVSPTGGFSGNVNFTVSGAPPGATTSFTPSSTSSSSTLKILTTSSARIGTYTLTITGKSGTLSHTTTVTLQIRRT